MSNENLCDLSVKFSDSHLDIILATVPEEGSTEPDNILNIFYGDGEGEFVPGILPSGEKGRPSVWITAMFNFNPGFTTVSLSTIWPNNAPPEGASQLVNEAKKIVVRNGRPAFHLECSG